MHIKLLLVYNLYKKTSGYEVRMLNHHVTSSETAANANRCIYSPAKASSEEDNSDFYIRSSILRGSFVKTIVVDFALPQNSVKV